MEDLLTFSYCGKKTYIVKVDNSNSTDGKDVFSHEEAQICIHTD